MEGKKLTTSKSFQNFPAGNKIRPKWIYYMTTMVFRARIAVFGGISELLTDGHTYGPTHTLV